MSQEDLIKFFKSKPWKWFEVQEIQKAFKTDIHYSMSKLRKKGLLKEKYFRVKKIKLKKKC